MHVFIHFQSLESIYSKWYICKPIQTKLYFEVSQAQYSEPAPEEFNSILPLNLLFFIKIASEQVQNIVPEKAQNEVLFR